MACFVLCESESDSDEFCQTSACELEANNVLTKLDESVDPCEDFYLFACGNFINETEIPGDKTFISRFSILDNKLKAQLNEVLSSSSSYEDKTPLQNCKKLFTACMNEGKKS